jgi:hypothetical protein
VKQRIPPVPEAKFERVVFTCGGKPLSPRGVLASRQRRWWKVADSCGRLSPLKVYDQGLALLEFGVIEVEMTADELAAAVGTAAAHELTSALNRIKHCLEQLHDEQVWWRFHPSLNSIGNLILHLCGNVRQWIVLGIGDASDIRNRPAEFAERGPIPKDELVRRLEMVVEEAKRVLAAVTAEQLLRLRVRRIQGFDVSGLTAIFDSVPHFRGHTQEIVHMTRLQLGDGYRFAWQPTTPEQGATA